MSAVHTAIRIRSEDLAEIDRQARARGVTRTSFLVDGSLHRLPQHRDQLEQRITTLEAEVQRLAAALFA